jgi:hypothetical protein
MKAMSMGRCLPTNAMIILYNLVNCLERPTDYCLIKPTFPLRDFGVPLDLFFGNI